MRRHRVHRGKAGWRASLGWMSGLAFGAAMGAVMLRVGIGEATE